MSRMLAGAGVTAGSPAALDTSIATVERTRRQLVEEGLEAVLARKYNPATPPGRGFSTARRKQN